MTTQTQEDAAVFATIIEQSVAMAVASSAAEADRGHIINALILLFGQAYLEDRARYNASRPEPEGTVQPVKAI